jgi:ABC-type lipoprotein export system ATPase subunit
VPKQDQENIINKLLIDYKIEKLKDVVVKDLSIYDRYYVSLARLGYRKIELLLIDNIFEELDEKECKALFNVIKKDYIKQGTTIVYATSDEKLAESISTRVVKLKDGVIIK